MEEFLNINWNPPDNCASPFVTTEYLRKNSCLYKILLDKNAKVFSSDSSDTEEDEEGTMKAQKFKKNDKSQESGNTSPPRPDTKTYIPGDNRKPSMPQKSSLNTAEHAAFLRLMLLWKNKQLPSCPSSSQQRDLQTYRVMQDIVVKEQSNFLAYVKSHWSFASKRLNFLHPEVRRYTEEVWQHHLDKVYSYPRFYCMHINAIPLVYPANRLEIQLELVDDLLEIGELPLLLIPTLKTPTRVCTEYAKMTVKHPPAGVEQDHDSLYQVTVSKDKNAEYLAQVHRADVVISSSGLQHIVNNVTPFDKAWTLPVVVKEEKFKENGVDKRRTVVFIDKALPPKAMSAVEKNIWYHKLAVKSLVCHPNHPNARRFSGSMGNGKQLPPVIGKSPIKNKAEKLCQDCATFLKSREIDSVNSEPFGDDDNSSDSNETDALVIDCESDEKQQSITLKVQEHKAPPPSKECTCGKFLRQGGPQDEPSAVGDSSKGNQPLAMEMPDTFTHVPPASKTNVTYRLWRLSPMRRKKEDLREDFLKGLGSCREVKLIVRCKVDACEKGEDLQLMCVSPKLEYQYEYGAEMVTPSDIIRQWTALQFRPRAKLARIRISAVSSEVLMTEVHTLQSVLQEGVSQKLRVRSSSLGMLYNVLSKLIELEPGHYLLSHSARNTGFASVQRHVPQGGDYDLHTDYMEVNPSKAAPDVVQPPWTPIDPNVVTPIHKAYNQIPATFEPSAYRSPPRRRSRRGRNTK